MNIKNVLFKNTVINYIAAFVDVAVGLVILPLLLIHLGDDLYGLLRLILTIAGYLAIMEIGVGTTAVKYISQHIVRKEHEEIRKLITNSVVFYTGIGLIIFMLLLVISFFFIDIFNIPPEYLDIGRTSLCITGLFSLFLWPFSFFRKVLEGMQKYVVASGMICLSALVRLGTVYYIITCHDGGLISILIIYLSINLIQNIIFYLCSRKSLGYSLFSFSLISRDTFRKIFSFTWILFVINICGHLLYQTDRIVLGLFLPVSSIALYEGPFKIHMFVRRMNSIVGTAVIPAASSLNAEGSDIKIKELFLRGSKYATIIILPLTVSAVIFAEYIIKYWLGPRYDMVVFPAQLFVSSWAVHCSVSLGGAILIAQNKMKYVLWYSIGLTVSNLILSVLLVMYLGNFTGVIWGTVIPSYIGYPVYVCFILGFLNIPKIEFLKKVILPTYPLIVIPMSVACILLKWRLPADLFEVALYMAIVMGFFFIAAYCFSLRQKEKKDVKNFLKSLFGKQS